MLKALFQAKSTVPSQDPAMIKIKSRYSTAQLLRFPLLFAGILGVFLTGFIYRKVYFAEELKAVLQKNQEEALRRQEIMERAKEQMAAEVAARSKAK